MVFLLVLVWYKVKRHLFKAGNHGSTYGGTPLACRAALAVVQLLQQGVIANAAIMGAYMIQGFQNRIEVIWM
jgi:acetylornithine/N-succinyldiaminopimelate aminotransferase